MNSDIFLRAAEVAQRNLTHSCVVLDNLGIEQELLDSYWDMFNHDVEGYGDRSLVWWDVDPADTVAHEMRVTSLLLAHEMHLTGDL